ncbi:hypothetical protein RQP46_002151 [Phenoliferia psychrophenolica]
MTATPVSFKVTLNGAVRLLTFTEGTPPTWDVVSATIKERFVIPDVVDIVLKYDDADGDVISLSTTTELRELWPPTQKIFYIEASHDSPPPLLPIEEEGLAYLPPETSDERAGFLSCLEDIHFLPGTPTSTEDKFWRDVLRVVDRRASGGLAQLGYVVKKNKPTFVGVDDGFEFERIQQQDNYPKDIRDSARRFEDRPSGLSAYKSAWTSRPTCFSCGGSHSAGANCPFSGSDGIYDPQPFPGRRPGESELDATRRRIARERDSRPTSFFTPRDSQQNNDYAASPRPPYHSAPFGGARSHALPPLPYGPTSGASFGGYVPRSPKLY